MVMSTGIRELSGMINGVCLGDPLCNRGAVDVPVPEADDDPESFFNHNGLIEPPLFIPEFINGAPQPQTTPAAGLQPASSPCSEDADVFSDIALSYISEILMEEEMDDRAGLLPQQISPALRDAVRPFYEVLLTDDSLPAPPSLLPLFCDGGSGSPEESGGGGFCSNSISSGSPSGVLDEGCLYEFAEQPSPGRLGGGAAFSVDYASQTSFGSSNSAGSLLDFADGPPGGTTTDEELLEQLWQYNKGMEEAIKFLPDQQKIVIDLEATTSPTAAGDDRDELPKTQTGRHRKNPHHDDESEPEEGRSAKHTAVICCSDEEDVPQKMFDDVLLCPPGRPNEAISSLREALQIELGSKAGNIKNGHGGRSRGRRQAKNKLEVVDLRTLLIHCAQAVATDDRRSAGELLKQIRQHSSMDGDGSQRLAHCFADALEARMAGTGAELYRSLAAKTRSAASILKAYHLYLAACPFKKVSHFFANQTILRVADGASRLHIVDFGIYFGFQWPCLIQRLSLRAGGPPKLRITGIELPQQGFRPAERVEETGRRLAEYARRFGVPFEYRPIAARWEDIEVGDLGIGGGGGGGGDGDREVLVVNCLYRFKNLVDETVVAESPPRDGVLGRIRRMRPDLFVHGVVNGAYGAPFFATRFREALFHFSALFDMMEATVPREHAERKLIEREILGRQATNVIACEGGERVERPETYKQWQARNLRAGLVQLPLHHGILRKTKDKVRNCYHKDFLIDEDGGWLLQGWKGRLLYALSTWAPAAGGGGF